MTNLNFPSRPFTAYPADARAGGGHCIRFGATQVEWRYYRQARAIAILSETPGRARRARLGTSKTDEDAAASPACIVHAGSMRVRIDGGGEDEAARIAHALAAGGFVISACDDPCDLVLTVGETLPTRVRLGDHVVDFERRRVNCQGQAIWLTPAEFGLLGYLHQARRPVSRTELLRELWGLRFDPQTNSVAVHVSRLRRKLGPTAILTEPEGYRMGAWSGAS